MTMITIPAINAVLITGLVTVAVVTAVVDVVVVVVDVVVVVVVTVDGVSKASNDGGVAVVALPYR
jgi:hypothetical protein